MKATLSTQTYSLSLKDIMEQAGIQDYLLAAEIKAGQLILTTSPDKPAENERHGGYTK